MWPRSGSPVSAAENRKASRASCELAASQTTISEYGQACSRIAGHAPAAAGCAPTRATAPRPAGPATPVRRARTRRTRRPQCASPRAARRARAVPRRTARPCRRRRSTTSKSCRRARSSFDPGERHAAREPRNATRGADAQARHRALAGGKASNASRPDAAQAAQRAERRAEQAHEPVRERDDALAVLVAPAGVGAQRGLVADVGPRPPPARPRSLRRGSPRRAARG